ncbi:hypothetical protein NQ318_012744 [Aromia moschata]|uniref:Uncharacterized protein n=1 Tax=Aromia moschata TaxID=1265417 RepID=A0AAV8XB07_9CUCU|nr:hypothetical protein NQ318_012744 [Aromia moschata]
MVSEESCTLSNKICKEQISGDKDWLSDGINKMSTKSQNDTNESPSDRVCVCDGNSTNDTDIVFYTRTQPVECRNNFVNTRLHRRSASDCIVNNCVIDENDNQIVGTVTPKLVVSEEITDKKTKERDKKKKLSFTFFKKKDKGKTKDHKIEEESETHDNLPQLPVFRSNTLGKSKKYASALELHQAAPTVLQRTPSFIKRLVHMGEDSSNFLKRSLSFRDINKKKEKQPSRDKLSVKKNQEWKQSLQSLVETDTSVSYKDLSFINYDALNNINYKETVHLTPGSPESRPGFYIGRTQSMIEKDR